MGFVREHSLLSYQVDEEMLHVGAYFETPYSLFHRGASSLQIRSGYTYSEPPFFGDNLTGKADRLTHEDRSALSAYYIQLDDTVREGRLSRQLRYRYDRDNATDTSFSAAPVGTASAPQPVDSSLPLNGALYRHTLSYSLGYDVLERKSASVHMSGKMGGIAAGMTADGVSGVHEPLSLFSDDVHFGYMYGVEGSLRILDSGRFSLTGVASLEYYTLLSDNHSESRFLALDPGLIPGRDMSFSLSVQYRF
ncbi:hypothetical protein [Desulfurispirillum indicum]|uniref:hypothetical protein n=1 Tax=Desulfurispirillum indicum TaxID=936456 RepID=UPI0003026519|nr:hypothetical protein [Desulfurispirillum indicum]